MSSTDSLEDRLGRAAIATGVLGTAAAIAGNYIDPQVPQVVETLVRTTPGIVAAGIVNGKEGFIETARGVKDFVTEGGLLEKITGWATLVGGNFYLLTAGNDIITSQSNDLTATLAGVGVGAGIYVANKVAPPLYTGLKKLASTITGAIGWAGGSIKDGYDFLFGEKKRKTPSRRSTWRGRVASATSGILSVLQTALPAFGNAQIGDFARNNAADIVGTDIRGDSTITAETINKVLEKANSPAAGTGESWIKWADHYGVDAAYALAVFREESSYGKSGVAATTKGIGNVSYTATALPDWKHTTQYEDEDGNIKDRHWAGYDTWDKSIEGWFNYITKSSHYFPKGKTSLEEIIPIYAPGSDGNRPRKYIKDVRRFVREYRELESQGTANNAVPVALNKPAFERRANRNNHKLAHMQMKRQHQYRRT